MKNLLLALKEAENLSLHQGLQHLPLRKTKSINQPAVTNILNQNYPLEKSLIFHHVPTGERSENERGTRKWTKTERENFQWIRTLKVVVEESITPEDEATGALIVVEAEEVVDEAELNILTENLGLAPTYLLQGGLLLFVTEKKVKRVARAQT